MKKKLIKRVITSLVVVFTFVSCFYTISLMSNENNVKAMEQQREDLLLLSEAYKWIDEEDIDPTTGKLKEGVIYNIGDSGRALTSEGFKQFNFLDANSGVTPLVEYKTAGEVAYINYAQNRNEVLFSNSFLVDFDLTYEEGTIGVERKKYQLVKTENKQSSYQDKRTRLVMKSTKVKVGWFKITVWYPAIETYYETVIVNTPHNTYDEKIETIGGVDLNENTPLSNFIDMTITGGFGSLLNIATEMDTKLSVVLLDAIVDNKPAVLQFLSLVADFVPVLDEVKTTFETIKGYDMFTGESIGTFWRIFGAVMLVVTAVVGLATIGAGSLIVDAATDMAQAVKKFRKVADKSGDSVGVVKSVFNTMKKMKSMDGVSNVSYKAARAVYKNADAFQMLVDKGADLSRLTKVLNSSKGSKFLKNITKNSGDIRNLTKLEIDKLLDSYKDFLKLAENGGDVLNAYKIADGDIFKTLGTLSENGMKLLDNNKALFTTLMEKGGDAKQITKILNSKNGAKKIKALTDNIDDLSNLGENALNIALRHTDALTDMNKKGLNVVDVLSDLGNIKMEKAGDYVDDLTGQLGKKFNVKINSDIWDMDPKIRGSLLDDALGNNIDNYLKNGALKLDFSDGSSLEFIPLGGSAKDCDNLVKYTDSAKKSTTYLTSRKSVDGSKYSDKEFEKLIDGYYDKLKNHERTYTGAQRVDETGLSKDMLFGQDYQKLALEIDVENLTDSQNDILKKVIDKYNNDYKTRNDTTKDIYDVIINYIK